MIIIKKWLLDVGKVNEEIIEKIKSG